VFHVVLKQTPSINVLQLAILSFE